MLRVSIVGATGYSGVELVRILLDHPKVELADLVSRSYVGQEFAQVFPAFRGKLDKVCKALDVVKLAQSGQKQLAFTHRLVIKKTGSFVR